MHRLRGTASLRGVISALAHCRRSPIARAPPAAWRATAASGETSAVNTLRRGSQCASDGVDLAGRQARVDDHRPGVQSGNAEQQRQQRRTVLADDEHAIAAANAGVGEARRDASAAPAPSARERPGAARRGAAPRPQDRCGSSLGMSLIRRGSVASSGPRRDSAQVRVVDGGGKWRRIAVHTRSALDTYRMSSEPDALARPMIRRLILVRTKGPPCRSHPCRAVPATTSSASSAPD